jgi:tRNA1(Val) A37 N6-methylase TrmN6
MSIVFKYADLDNLTIEKCLNAECDKKDTIHLNHPVLMSNEKRVLNIYKKPLRRTIFDGVEAVLDSNKYPHLFGPNIDTILCCHSIKIHKSKIGRIESFYEIGVGSGFIAKYMAEKFKPKVAFLNDIQHESIAFCIDDLDLPPLHLEKRVTKKIVMEKKNIEIIKKNGYIFIRGDGLLGLKLLKEPVDMILCNPPYIPRVADEGDDSKISNFFEGTRLMRFLLTDFQRFAKKAIMIVSSVSFLNLKIAGLLRKVKFDVMYSMKVPLKVWNDAGVFISDDKPWYNFLTSKNNMVSVNNNKFRVGAIKGGKEDNYPLYHIVNVLYLYT